MFLLTRPSLYKITGPSMSPTLADGDIALVVERRGMVRRGQIAIIDMRDTSCGQRWHVKRVVGLPGECIEFENGLIFIDGIHHREPYLRGLPAAPEALSAAWDIDTDACFVMGDNRAHSTDSRRFGPMPLDTVVGVVEVRLWPPFRRARRLSTPLG